jgi:hypothetical protein
VLLALVLVLLFFLLLLLEWSCAIAIGASLFFGLLFVLFVFVLSSSSDVAKVDGNVVSFVFLLLLLLLAASLSPFFLPSLEDDLLPSLLEGELGSLQQTDARMSSLRLKSPVSDVPCVSIVSVDWGRWREPH